MDFEGPTQTILWYFLKLHSPLPQLYSSCTLMNIKRSFWFSFLHLWLTFIQGDIFSMKKISECVVFLFPLAELLPNFPFLISPFLFSLSNVWVFFLPLQFLACSIPLPAMFHPNYWSPYLCSSLSHLFGFSVISHPSHTINSTCLLSIAVFSLQLSAFWAFYLQVPCKFISYTPILYFLIMDSTQNCCAASLCKISNLPAFIHLHC